MKILYSVDKAFMKCLFLLFFTLFLSKSFANEVIDYRSDTFRNEIVQEIINKIFVVQSEEDMTAYLEKKLDEVGFDRTQYPDVEKEIIAQVGYALPIAAEGIKHMGELGNIEIPKVSLMQNYGQKYGVIDALDTGLIVENSLDAFAKDPTNASYIINSVLEIKDPKVRAKMLTDFSSLGSFSDEFWILAFDTMLKKEIIDLDLMNSILAEDLKAFIGSGEELFRDLLETLLEMEKSHPEIFVPPFACSIAQSFFDNKNSIKKELQSKYIAILEASIYSEEILDIECNGTPLVTKLKDLHSMGLLDLSKSFIREWVLGDQAGCGNKYVNIDLGETCEWQYVLNGLGNRSRLAKAIATLKGQKDPFINLGQFPEGHCDIEYHERIVRNKNTYISTEVDVIIKESPTKHRKLTEEEKSFLLEKLNSLNKDS